MRQSSKKPGHQSNKFIIAIITIVLALWLPVPAQADTESQLKAVDKSIRLRDYRLAVKQLQPLIKQNIAEAQYRLAGLYRSGKGVKSNLIKATRLYEKAAINGLPDAQYTLASILEKKAATQRGSADAIRWYRAAADQGYRKAVKKLARLKKTSSVKSNPGISHELIFSAIRHNNKNKIRSMIKHGVNMDIIDAGGRTPLMAALLAEYLEISSLLLPETTYLNKPDHNNNRPVHIATSHGYINLVRGLILKKVDINAADALGNTALIIATRHDNAKILELLLNNNADHKIKNKKKQSAPYLAQTLDLKKSKSIFVKYKIGLPKKNRDYTKIDLATFKKTINKTTSLYKGWPLLNIASLLGEKDIVKQLISQGANLDATDKAGNSALHRAASKGQLDTVKILISNGSQLNAINDKRETPLYQAAEAGQFTIIKYLLKKNADTSIVAKNKSSALLIAILGRHKKSANILSAGMLDNKSVHKALMLAIQNKMENLSVKLLQRDRLINQGDKKNRSALWHSTNLGLNKISSALINNNNVDINMSDSNGYTALANSVYTGQIEISKSLVKNGARLNSLTGENNTLLMLSVLSQNKKITEFLLTKNAAINSSNKAGDTALMLAAAKGHNDMVILLIKAGAKLQARNQDDQNAYQIATNSGHKETAELIRKNSGSLFKLFN